jgi:hypothetical protein
VSLERRNFLRHAAEIAAVGAIPVLLLGLTSCSIRGAVRLAGPGEGGYGELAPSRNCPELAVPTDFHVCRLSVSGERMSDGVSTPGDFDGMAAFPLPDGPWSSSGSKAAGTAPGACSSRPPAAATPGAARSGSIVRAASTRAS